MNPCTQADLFILEYKEIIHRNRMSDWIYFKREGKVFNCRAKTISENGKVYLELKTPVKEVVYHTNIVSKEIRSVLEDNGVPILHPRKIKRMKERNISLEDIVKDQHPYRGKKVVV